MQSPSRVHDAAFGEHGVENDEQVDSSCDISGAWSQCADVPAIAQPATVIAWPSPHATGATRQIVEAVGPDAEVVRLVRDHDGIYGSAFDARVDDLCIEQLRIAPTAP